MGLGLNGKQMAFGYSRGEFGLEYVEKKWNALSMELGTKSP